MSHNDTDYLSLSTRLRVLETRLLNRSRQERMLEAKTPQEAAKVLTECGYTVPDRLDREKLSQMLAENRDAVFADLAAACPNAALVDAFRLKYDYHNCKVLLRAAALGTAPERLLVDAGTIPARRLQQAIFAGEPEQLPQALIQPVREAGETLNATRDPQRCDLVLDRAYWRQLSTLAKTSKSTWLQDYVTKQIDYYNLRSAVRALRLGKDGAFLNLVLVPGGSISPEQFRRAALGGTLDALCARLGNAGALVPGALTQGQVTAFEKACDNDLNDALKAAKLLPFGDGVVVAYLAAKEAEYTAVRILLTGRLAGLDADTIRERLRESYV